MVVVIGGIFAFLVKGDEHGIPIVSQSSMPRRFKLQRNINIFFSVFLTTCAKTLLNLGQVGNLNKGINPLSIAQLTFQSRHMKTAVKAGLLSGILALAVRT
jgi:sulfate transporter 3